jgi:hypothetical protein
MTGLTELTELRRAKRVSPDHNPVLALFLFFFNLSILLIPSKILPSGEQK